MRPALSFLYRLPPPVRRALRRLPGAGAVRRAATGRPRRESPPAGSSRPLVYLPTWAEWDVMRQRPQYVVGAFAAAGHPAYFVDPRAPKRRSVGGVEIVPSLEDTPGKDVILYIHFAPLADMIDHFENPVVIYDILDDLSIYEPDEVGIPEGRRVRSYHPSMMERADIVMASAPALIATHRSERDDIVYVENGVDPGAFGAPAPRPPDVPDSGGPIAGYHGMIARWFDFDLMDQVARDRRDIHFVLVGPVDPDTVDALSALTRHPNVHHLGPRPSSEIAAYVQSFDVGLVPFVVDDLTEAVSPLKMYEYMAAGVPVVATQLPVCVQHPMVVTASAPSEFGKAIAEAVVAGANLDYVAALRRAAADASWSSRLQPVFDRLADLDLRRVPD